MNKYFFLGALEAFLFSLPVPLALVLLSAVLPLGVAYAGAALLAAVLVHRFALPLLRQKRTSS